VQTGSAASRAASSGLGCGCREKQCRCGHLTTALRTDSLCRSVAVSHDRTRLICFSARARDCSHLTTKRRLSGFTRQLRLIGEASTGHPGVPTNQDPGRAVRGRPASPRPEARAPSRTPHETGTNTAIITTLEAAASGAPRLALRRCRRQPEHLSAATSCDDLGAPGAMILASVRQIAALPAPRVAHCPEHRARRTPRRPLW